MSHQKLKKIFNKSDHEADLKRWLKNKSKIFEILWISPLSKKCNNSREFQANPSVPEGLIVRKGMKTVDPRPKLKVHEMFI